MTTATERQTLTATPVLCCTPTFTYVHPSPNYVFGYEEDYAEPGHFYSYSQPRELFDKYSRDLIELGVHYAE